jgi:Leucine-rich repeat (LRR) protein
MDLFIGLDLEEIDFSFNNISALEPFSFPSLKKIDLRNIRFLCDLSFEMFLNSNVTDIDFSNNKLEMNLKLLENMTKLEIIELSNTGLDSIEELSLFKFKSLIELDLSKNNLTNITYDSFKNLNNLQYLDLSDNQISSMDTEIFKIITNALFINLDNNKLSTVGSLYLNYMSIQTLMLSNNQLETYPTFDVNFAINVPTRLTKFYLNKNNLTNIAFFSEWLAEVEYLNFDDNKIEFIEANAFVNLRGLNYLTIANNKLTKIAKNNFNPLFSLTRLNLSNNYISHIENGSFQNLNKLIFLDLSFNSFKSIENNVFYGLFSLKSLYLNSFYDYMILEQSFNHLIAASNIYLNESLLYFLSNKCFFINSLKRKVERQINEFYFYYSSINLITNSNEISCELTFELIQFNIHLNIKSENDFENFYTKCYNFITISNFTYKAHYEECGRVNNSTALNNTETEFFNPNLYP